MGRPRLAAVSGPANPIELSVDGADGGRALRRVSPQACSKRHFIDMAAGVGNNVRVIDAARKRTAKTGGKRGARRRPKVNEAVAHGGDRSQNPH